MSVNPEKQITSVSRTGKLVYQYLVGRESPKAVNESKTKVSVSRINTIAEVTSAIMAG